MRFTSLSSRPLYLVAFLALVVSPLPLRSEIVFQRSGPQTGVVDIAPYPAPGTNFITWLGAGSPGVWITTFAPATNGIIRSVTIEMADSVSGSEPLAGGAPEGGFSLSLCQVNQSSPGINAIEIIAVLEGSDNPATEGSYTYTVPEGLELRGPHVLLAMVEPSGGSFRWKQTNAGPAVGSGGGPGFVITAGSASSTTIDSPLDLDNVVIFLTDSFAPLFTVEADDRPAGITLTPAKSFAPTGIGEESRVQRITIRNNGVAQLTGLAVRGDAKARRHFKFSQPGLKSLTAGSTTEFPVSFRPRGSGRITGALTVTGSAGTAKLRLRGRGVNPPPQSSIREPRAVD